MSEPLGENRKRVRRRAGVAALSLALLGLIVSGRTALATEVIQLTLEQVVRGASDVVIARVQSAESRWGDESKRWMLTDYTLLIEQSVVGNAAAGAHLKVTFWGGTLDGETQRVAGMQLPVVGQRHVLMLSRGWQGSRGSPIVGLDQGLFVIQRDNTTGKDIVLDRGRRAVQRTPAGSLAVAQTSQGSTDAISLAEFVVWISNVPPGSDSPAFPTAAATRDSRILRPITLRPELPGEQTIAAAGPTRRPERGSTSEMTPPPSDERTGVIIGDPTVATSERVGAQYTWSAPAAAPIVVNQFPPSFAPWSPEDQFQMSKWNHYAADVFRVFVTPTGSYGWPNGRFDLAGWPSSADTQRVYGYTWGAGTLGICFQRITHQIIEADIALNPAYSWTLDDEWVYDGSSAIGFRATMIHELGHMWGLEHNFSWLSLMNYLPLSYRAYALPFSDDAEALRTAHPSRVVGRTDLGVYLFRWDDLFDTVFESQFPSSVVAGVSNAGKLVSRRERRHGNDYEPGASVVPDIRAFGYAGSTTFLGNTTMFVNLPRFFHVNPASASAFLNVPLGMDGGLYYLNALSTLAGGASQGSFPFAHNGAWSRSRIRVYPALNGLDGGWHAGGSPGEATLYLIGRTDITGLDVTLESGDPSILTVPPNLHVGPFVRDASILMFTNPVSVRREVLLTARSHGKSVAGIVVVLPASKSVLKDKTGPLTELVALKATFTQVAGGAPLAGVPVTFRIDGDLFVQHVFAAGPNLHPVRGNVEQVRVRFGSDRRLAAQLGRQQRPL